MDQFQVRPVRREELADVQDAQFEALSDMHRRHGLPLPPAPTALSPLLVHLFEHHGGGGFFVAEAEGRVVALMIGLLREGNWFLSSFWCRPAWQGKGVGAALREAMRPVVAAADVACVYASYDPPAMSTYQKLGMWARAPFFRFALPDGLRVAPGPAWGGAVRQIDALSAADLEAVGSLDRAVRGCRRDLDHQFILAQPGTRLLLFERKDRLAAYAWTWKGGRIGPAAAADPADMPAVLATAASGSEAQPVLQVPGDNVAAVSWCLDQGFRITDHALFFSNKPFGQFDRYIITNPGLL
ncbi:MAG: GNAT family N-acetyltransferase [Bacillota bacterium]